MSEGVAPTLRVWSLVLIFCMHKVRIYLFATFIIHLVAPQILRTPSFLVSPGYYSRPKINWKPSISRILGCKKGVLWAMQQWQFIYIKTSSYYMQFIRNVFSDHSVKLMIQPFVCLTFWFLSRTVMILTLWPWSPSFKRPP